jgi:hypothetical protein
MTLHCGGGVESMYNPYGILFKRHRGFYQYSVPTGKKTESRYGRNIGSSNCISKKKSRWDDTSIPQNGVKINERLFNIPIPIIIGVPT